MISVIIPLYNKEDFIEEAIHSVLRQSYKKFELLVIDDGSTDKSHELVESIKDNRLKLIKIEHSGVSTARNTGVRASKFDWVAFLDADDWWDSNFLKEMVHAIKTFKDVKLFASGRIHVFKDSQKPYSNPYLPLFGETGAVNFFKIISRFLPVINSSNAVLRKSLFEDVGYFRNTQKMHEDHDLWIRLSVGNNIVFVNKHLSYYRNTDSFSASNLYYEPEDFCIFLRTLIDTRKRLTKEERVYFEKYANHFVTITYIKNYHLYSQVEDKKVVNLAKCVVSLKYRFLIMFLHFLPFKKTYRYFKLFQIQKWNQKR